MGLGSWPDVSLAEARQSAEQARSLVRMDRDPISDRQKRRREAERNLHTLADIASDAFAARKSELKDDGKAGRWLSPLTIHVLPKLGRVPIAEIDQAAIRDTLRPIWHEKADTARKAMNRLNIVVKHAAALGLDVDIQVVEKAKALLGKQVHEVTHIPSMPWREIPAFWEKLEMESSVHLALKFLILTAVRTDGVRHAHVDDFDSDVWTVPARHLKGRKGQTKDFRVPLCPEAKAIVEAAKPLAFGGYLFCGPRGKPLSDMAMSKRMKDMNLDARPHGFRASFRTWCEQTNAPWNVAETALTHVIESKVQRAYQRDDLLEQRRFLMAKWAKVVTCASGELVTLHG